MFTAKEIDTGLRSNRYWKTCISLFPDLSPEYIDAPLEDVMDSIGLLTLRAELEALTGKPIEDNRWLSYSTIRDIIDSLENMTRQPGLHESISDFTAHRPFHVNMPQMAIKALSENWLFKEMGALHWDTLCKGLSTRSKDICDENGNRLYATFVRIRFTCNKALDAFIENDEGDMQAAMKRYGEGIYISELQVRTGETVIHATLMSSFSARQGTGNKTLLKSQPSSIMNHIPAYESVPLFTEEYRKIKKMAIEKSLVLTDADNDNGCIYETAYELNPFYDINGVGLLYFAAYPVINDICESRYFDQQGNKAAGWAFSWSTAERDVLYYGNCNSDDSIIYRLYSIEHISDKYIRLESTLRRLSDNTIIASVFTLKKKRMEAG